MEQDLIREDAVGVLGRPLKKTEDVWQEERCTVKDDPIVPNSVHRQDANGSWAVPGTYSPLVVAQRVDLGPPYGGVASLMNQQCKVCGEPAAGFHFGAFTCEGCKSFFGRSYNNLNSISECKNNGECVINKKNRTSCKACRLRKCLLVGMSKSGSRYGRRSNWFKIHCLLQEQKQKDGAEQKLQMQIASINRSKDELLLLGIDDYKPTSPSISSPDSVSDSSDNYRPLFKDVPHYIPYMFPHPAYLPPLTAGLYPGYMFSGRCYDDNFNRTERSPTPDSPIDLSLKTSGSTAAEDSSSDEDITVDDELPSEDMILRRTAPLDLTTKVN